ncbi:ATP-grasp domain-containing protein [Candidatus Saccharibacteria bacterium]|nr:ATP-grasp domain-containing protein [Candidatus Saccharibacteria bacterium]
MKFYCVVDKTKGWHTFSLLENSVKARSISWVPIEAKEIDVSTLVNVEIEPGDILYRLGSDDELKFAEALLMRDYMTSFYRNPNDVFARSFNWGSTIRMLRAGVAIVPTQFGVAENDDDIMRSVEILGGFPVVIKSSGGSYGSGVRMANSLDELRRQVNELEQNNQRVVLRQFIANARHVRCVVVGDKAVDAIELLPVEGDFRTNATDKPQMRPFARDDKIFALAEKAVKAGVTEFGGVDILISEDGTAYVTEVNFPCHFGWNQMCTGADISGMMTDYLVSKAKQVLQTHTH